MSKKSKKGKLSLVCLDIEGEWNVPLLENAASISDASLLFAGISASECRCRIADIFRDYDNVLACETGKNSRNIFLFPSPRDNTALIVGNEERGIPKEILRETSNIVSIPMYGKGMSSVNVAVAAAISLYTIQSDFARKSIHKSRLKPHDIDVLVASSDDPSELGCLFRSIWAFGWKKVYLSDRKETWFVKERSKILAGRAAARRFKNPLVIIPANELIVKRYDKLILCRNNSSGTAVSKLRLPDRGRVLLAFGNIPPELMQRIEVEEVFVDFSNYKIRPNYRHTGSILFSVISQMLQRVSHE